MRRILISLISLLLTAAAAGADLPAGTRAESITGTRTEADAGTRVEIFGAETGVCIPLPVPGKADAGEILAAGALRMPQEALRMPQEALQSRRPTAAAIDSLTWKLYLEKDWPALRRSARKAFREGIDFYYLRVRAGVAAYEMQKPGSAVRHLEKARETYPDDDFTNGYLYSSLVLAGRDDEANFLAARLNGESRLRLGIPLQGPLNSLSVDNYLSRNTGQAALLEEKISDEGSLSSYRNVLRRQWYKNAGFDLHLSPRLNLYTNISHIAIDRTQHFSSAANQMEVLMETTTSQFQFYSQGRLILGKGWSAFTSATLLRGESHYHLPLVASPGNYSFTEASLPITDWLINGGVTREMDWMAPRLSLTRGNINGWNQWQLNGQWVLYPLGNPTFYLVSEGTLHLDESAADPKILLSQKIALKTGPVWLSGEFTRGTIANFSTGEGLVVYNMPETITSMSGATLWVPLFGYRLNATLRYMVAAKKGTTFVYANATDYTVSHYRFNDQSLLISLKWNF